MSMCKLSLVTDLTIHDDYNHLQVYLAMYGLETTSDWFFHHLLAIDMHVTPSLI